MDPDAVRLGLERYLESGPSELRDAESASETGRPGTGLGPCSCAYPG